MVKVIDSFLSAGYFKEIQEVLLGNTFPWFYKNNITSYYDKNDINQYGFSSLIYEKIPEVYSSNYFDFLLPFMLQFSNKSDILRCRADMITNKNIELNHDIHVDFNFEHISSVFYVNESDGDTIVYKNKYPEEPNNLVIEEKICPKPNRLVIFDGLQWHTGKSPNKHNNRVIINTNTKKYDSSNR